VTLFYRIEKSLYFNPDLSRLPFDEPKLNIKIDIFSSYSDEMKKEFKFNTVYTTPIVGPHGMVGLIDKDVECIPEYDIAWVHSSITRPPEAKKNRDGIAYVSYPTVIVSLSLYRHPDYLVFSIVFPLLLLNVFTLSSFGVDSSDIGTKLGILVTILLALFTFTFTIRDKIPSVPYLTGLEKQILLSITILFLAGLELTLPFFVHDAVENYLRHLIIGVDIAFFTIYMIYFLINYVIYKLRIDYFDYENKEIYRKMDRKPQDITASGMYSNPGDDEENYCSILWRRIRRYFSDLRLRRKNRRLKVV